MCFFLELQLIAWQPLHAGSNTGALNGQSQKGLVPTGGNGSRALGVRPDSWAFALKGPERSKTYQPGIAGRGYFGGGESGWKLVCDLMRTGAGAAINPK